MISDQQFISWPKRIAIYLQALLYLFAGINHFLKPDMYAAIVPPPIPGSLAVYVSGVAEIIAGILLLFPSARSSAGIVIILLLIAVFPANIFMAIEYFMSDHPHAWLAILRLALQPLLIWLACWSTKNQQRQLTGFSDGDDHTLRSNI